MSEGGYKIRDFEGIHFVTFAVVGWIDVFTRRDYADIVIDSLQFCQQNKGLQLRVWCIMSNHVHLIASARDKNLSDILRDLKKHTSTKIIKAIAEHGGESRKEWMLPLFRQAGASNSRNTTNQFWQQDNHPIECYSQEFTKQKVDYVHDNPVSAGIVSRPEDYNYSSAIDYCGGKGFLPISLLW